MSARPVNARHCPATGLSVPLVKITYQGPIEPELLRTLPTPEVGHLLLLHLARNPDGLNRHNMFHGASVGYQGEHDVDVLLGRYSDAWAWLCAHGLLGPAPQDPDKLVRVTETGRELAQSAGALTKLWSQERLAGKLDQALEPDVRLLFNLGQYENACLAAMKAVEVEVRKAAGLGASTLGVSLMEEAFKVGGPLADSSVVTAEQGAVMQLFRGAIGAFKNPSSHRTVLLDDPVEAAEIVQFADLLLRIVRRAEARAAETGGP